MPALRERIAQRCDALQFRVTVVLASEGINLFSAGSIAAVGAIVPELRADARFAGQVVVTYCTRGMRCEKAVLLMREASADRLDGGILKYFEQAGASHYSSGGCLVSTRTKCWMRAFAQHPRCRYLAATGEQSIVRMNDVQFQPFLAE